MRRESYLLSARRVRLRFGFPSLRSVPPKGFYSKGISQPIKSQKWLHIIRCLRLCCKGGGVVWITDKISSIKKRKVADKLSQTKCDRQALIKKKRQKWGLSALPCEKVMSSIEELYSRPIDANSTRDIQKLESFINELKNKRGIRLFSYLQTDSTMQPVKLKRSVSN